MNKGNGTDSERTKNIKAMWGCLVILREVFEAVLLLAILVIAILILSRLDALMVVGGG